jgi:hypothetical protein
MRRSPVHLRLLLSRAALGAVFVAVSSCGGNAISGSNDSTGGGREVEPPGGTGGMAVAGGSGGGGTSGGGALATGGSGRDDCKDSDADGIGDAYDGHDSLTDTDGDGAPDYLDIDADGDGLSDEVEAGTDTPCERGRDTDGDGAPDFQDEDSDGDHVSDADEYANGMDAYAEDTNADGCGDLETFTFGGCSAAHLVVFDDWCSSTLTTSTTVKVRSDFSEPLDDLAVALVPADGNRGEGTVAFEVVSVTPADGGIIQGGMLESVAAGSEVTVKLTLEPGNEREQNYWVFELWSESENIIAYKRVLWVVTRCLRV